MCPPLPRTVRSRALTIDRFPPLHRIIHPSATWCLGETSQALCSLCVLRHSGGFDRLVMPQGCPSQMVVDALVAQGLPRECPTSLRLRAESPALRGTRLPTPISLTSLRSSSTPDLEQRLSKYLDDVLIPVRADVPHVAIRAARDIVLLAKDQLDPCKLRSKRKRARVRLRFTSCPRMPAECGNM
eukprot:4626356-Amphidinium_carterae.2